MAPSLAKETGDASTVGSNRICSNRRSRKNKYSDGETSTVRGRVSSKKPIYYGCEQEGEQELLHMWKVWIFSKAL